MEKLGQWLQKKVAEGRLREVRTSRGGPSLSHLFFADDLLLFSEACEEQLACIKEGLEIFCNCSVQRINFQKSSMFCSSNVSDEEAGRLSNVLGIPLAKKIGKYLGHHIVMDGKNRERYKEPLQKVQSKIECWKLKYLSRLGDSRWPRQFLGVYPSLICSWSVSHLGCIGSWIRQQEGVFGCLQRARGEFIYWTGIVCASLRS